MSPIPQPLDRILSERGLKSEDLVKASTAQLTFKQVKKARTGHPITSNIKNKILLALNACGDVQYKMEDLFENR